MYDIKKDNIKKVARIFSIFLIVGIATGILMVISIVGDKAKEKRLDSTTTAREIEVTSHLDDENDMLYTPIYHYVVAGKEYECSSKISSSNYPKIKDKTVYYNSKKPSECRTSYSKKQSNLFLTLLIIPIVFTTIGLIFIIRAMKKIKKIDKLNKKGKLVKNLSYRMENSNMMVNGHSLQKIVVDYKVPNGDTITLYSEPRMDYKVSYETDTVDIVIDEENPKNYYIGFEINRLSGNREEDYFHE